MKLINNELKQRFSIMGEQKDIDDPRVIAVFFNPVGEGTWYAISYNEERNTCFGYVEGLGYDEWCEFSMKELEELKLKPWGMKIERDMFYKETFFSELTGKTRNPEIIETQEIKQEKKQVIKQEESNHQQQIKQELLFDHNVNNELENDNEITL